MSDSASQDQRPTLTADELAQVTRDLAIVTDSVAGELAEAQDAIEYLTMAAQRLCQLTGYDRNMPDVTFDHLGRVAAIRSDLAGRLAIFNEAMDTLGDLTDAMCAFMSEQAAQNG